ncbi:MAG TPA: hypothetical protein PKA90_06955 [Ignavibacteria bacterium]|nr:hypothetical protein [Ignavibacteria bacterium]
MNFKEKLTLIIIIVTLFRGTEAFAEDPNFDLRLTNRNYISSNEGYFDIVLRHRNPEQSDFLYAGAEYVIILNTDFQTEHLNYVYSIDTATYGSERIPLNYIGGLLKNFDTLKIIQGDSIQSGNEPVISSSSGTLVARIRFYNPDLYSNSCLLEEQFSWKTGPPGVFTRVYFRNSGETDLINNSFSSFSTYDLCAGSFCCLEAPLHPPVRLSPENNDSELSAPVTLLWQKGFPVNYSARLQVAEDSAFNIILLDSSFTLPDGNEDVSLTLATLTAPGDYYWRVKQGGIPPQGAYNEAWKFTIIPDSINLNLTVIPEGLFRFNQFDFEYKAYLRNVNAPFEIVDSCNVSSSDSLFRNTLKFVNALPGTYYIVVIKNGCIETWSKEGGEYLAGGIVNEYDFSLDDSQAYYENMILVRNKYCMYSGDVNQDQNIDLYDVISVYYNSNSFNSINNHTDLTGDSITDLNDILITGNNSKKFVSSRSPDFLKM